MFCLIKPVYSLRTSSVPGFLVWLSDIQGLKQLKKKGPGCEFDLGLDLKGLHQLYNLRDDVLWVSEGERIQD